MNKKKVIELIGNVEKYLLAYEKSGKNADIAMAFQQLHEAQDEVQKPEWISVEDELPPIGERVWVCNIKKPDVVVSDYRSDTHNCNVYDGYGFLIGNHATHWRKIDKLDKIK